MLNEFNLILLYLNHRISDLKETSLAAVSLSDKSLISKIYKESIQIYMIRTIPQLISDIEI